MSHNPSPTPRESTPLGWLPLGPGCPQVLARIYRPMIALMLLPTLAALLIQAVFHPNWLRYGQLPFWLVLGSTMIVPQVWATVRVVPVRRAIRECRGRVCTNCLYDLRGQPDDGQCPECGQHYHMLTVVAQWKKFYPRLVEDSHS